ncbi:helix-turn-helix domain-containing protein [Acidicapsa acidisoli]|jgi:transcriptional regulator with XRE-family HTH domain|uniref:helix-turn-helix domain-containing protein n=1 Tax=Acidicapsa acidisoli TaxID=1615681 RepID=UPI0037C19EF3
MPREKSIFTREYAIFLSTLRRLRIEAGVTQSAVAKAMGRTQSVVSKCERSERRLDQIETMFYCKGIGIDYEAFVQILIDDLKGTRIGRRSTRPKK